MFKDPCVDQKRIDIVPKRESIGIPASVPAIIQPESGVSRRGGQALTLSPRNQLIVTAVNDQDRAGEMSNG